MNNQLQKFINSLREELQEYGQMLGLLNRQQELIASRASAEVLETVAQINDQSAVLKRVREERELSQTEIALQLGTTAEASFKEIISLVDEPHQPLVQALFEENNELLARIKQRARQNFVLLNRSLELIQKLMNSFMPGNTAVVYRGS